MDISTLKAQIIHRNCESFYIFTGIEWEVQKVYLQQIAKTTDCELTRIDSVSDIFGNLTNRSFIKKNRCYVVRDDKDLMTVEKIQDKIDAGILGDNRLILLLDSIDKRTKFYTRYKDKIVEFEPLADNVLKKYIQKEIELNDRNCDILIEVCEHNYGRILLEIDKIKRYVDYLGPAPMYDGAFQQLLKDGTIYEPPYDAIFDFVDAVLDRNVPLVYNLYQQCIDYGESNIVLISVLYNNAKALLQVQACDNKDIAKTTGLSAWQINSAKKHLKRYSGGELVRMLKTIQQVEQDVKFGVLDEDISILYILSEVL